MPHRTFITALACLLLPVLAAAHGPELRLPALDGLKQNARESVDITIGSWTLGIMSWLMDDRDPQSADVKKMLKRLKKVHVRSYEFDSDFLYPEAEIDALRSQLSGPGWSQLVQVRDRNKDERVDIYIAMEGRKVRGFAIIASDPRKFTIVNIVGAIDFEHLVKAQKALGLPDSNIAQIAQEAP
jgi:hypothetical protein